MSSASTYAPPLDRLLSKHRDVYYTDGSKLVQELGLTREHVPELVRMLGDASLYRSQSECQGPYLACRALGSLWAIEAVPEILRCTDRFRDEFQFWYEGLPGILGPIGPEILSTLADWLEGPEVAHTSSMAAFEILGWLVKHHPETRDSAVQMVTAFLARRIEEDDEDFDANGIAVSFLLDWHAVESTEVIERAYRADLVDPSICGDWPGVRFSLGIGPPPDGNSYGIDRFLHSVKRASKPEPPDPSHGQKRPNPLRIAKTQKRKPRR